MRTVLITGAARNIGADAAKCFSAAGYQVALNARTSDDIEKLARDINESGGRAIAVPGDIRDPAQVETMIDRVGAEYGGVDVLINNAMVRKHRPIEETSVEDWESVLGVVLTGSFNCIKAVLPYMRANEWGRIISLGGVAAQRGARDRAAVVTAKSGLFGLTKSVALETAREGITANVVSPGIIATDRGDLGKIGDEKVVSSHYEEEIAAIPMGRPGKLSEISGTCLFLASDTAAFITGQVLGVNGGRHM
jgi:3-oxoacyl-[acyl-carrier protein] reductase